MDRKRAITAGELLRQLEADPKYQLRCAVRDGELAKSHAICAADEKDLVIKIRGLGYDIDSVWDLVNNNPHPFLERKFIGLYEGAYGVLVDALKARHHPKVREGVIRSLTVKDGGRAVEDALLEEFNHEADRVLRWVLANALRTAMPYHRRRKYPEIAKVFRNGVA